MHLERTEVIAIEADRIRLAARRRTQCGGCAARSGCGIGLLDQFGRPPAIAIDLPRTSAPRGVEVGQTLLLEVPEGSILRASCELYGLPLLGLLTGAGFAALWFPAADAVAVTGSAAGLALGWLAARWRLAAGARIPLRCHPPPAGPEGGTEPRVIGMV